MKKYFGILVGILAITIFSLVPIEWAQAEDEIPWEAPEIFIKAINPGYTVNSKSNVGEMIEIGSRVAGPDNLVSLAGYKISYTTKLSGEEVGVTEFSENFKLASESIILRLASSLGNELANLSYKVPGASSGIAQGGILKIWKGEELVDSVCWTNEEGCERKFKSGSGENLVRDLKTGEWEFKTDYAPEYNADGLIILEEEGKGGAAAHCGSLEFSEILSYYAESQTEQFVEVFNAGAEQVLMDGCSLRYKNKIYPLTGLLKAESYFARYLTDFSITKNPTNGGVLEILDADGTVVDRLEYPNGQKKGTAWAMIGYDAAGEELWRTTYAVTPGEANVYQEYKTCEVGKVINAATGNCVKVTETTEKVCAEGQFLNPLTGRCKKITTEATTTCKDGYEVNPATGRCIKIKENTGADYSLTAENYEEKSSFVALYAIIAVVAVGAGYVIWEFRKEIMRFFKRFRR